MQIKDQMIFE
jgi:hypothetical protein